MSTPVPAPAPAGGGNVLQQRIGPFATWVWLLFATIAILIYAYLGSRKKAAAQTGQATASQSVASQQVPDIIIQNQEGTETEPAPPAGSVPPSAPPPTGPSIPPVKIPSRPKPPVGTGGGTKPPVTKPPVKKPPAPKFKIIKVARWTEENPPWNSTLWGIAQHEHVKGGWQELAKLNGITNPKSLRVGQEIRVPA